MKNLSLVAVIAISVLVSGQTFADNSKRKDERLGHYSLKDESMLGRYGDVNDEWVQSASVDVSTVPATKSRSNKKAVGKLGGYTLEDGSMLGRYGDHNDE